MSKRKNDSFKIDDLMKSFVKENKLEKGLDKVNVEAAWIELMGMGLWDSAKTVACFFCFFSKINKDQNYGCIP